MSYTPSPVPNDPQDIPRYLEEETDRVADAVNFPMVPQVQLEVRHNEPQRPRDGMIAYADGSDWDPQGDGTLGFFGYENGSWVKL